LLCTYLKQSTATFTQSQLGKERAARKAELIQKAREKALKEAAAQQ